MHPSSAKAIIASFKIVTICHGYKLQVYGIRWLNSPFIPSTPIKATTTPAIIEPQNTLFLALELAPTFFSTAVIPIPISIISNTNIRIYPIGITLICIPFFLFSYSISSILLCLIFPFYHKTLVSPVRRYGRTVKSDLSKILSRVLSPITITTDKSLPS